MIPQKVIRTMASSREPRSKRFRKIGCALSVVQPSPISHLKTKTSADLSRTVIVRSLFLEITMKPIIPSILAFLAISLAGCTSVSITEQSISPVPAEKSTAPIAITGYWEGELDIGQSIPIVIGFTFGQPDQEGILPAALHIPQQGLKEMKISASVEELSLHITMDALMASYEGTYDDESGIIEGTFTQMGQSLPLMLRRAQASVQRKMQEPVPPYPYISEDLRFPQLAEGFSLAGTITRPEGSGPFPAVVLVSGSGSQDRDETLFGHKPFLLLADTLTRAGIVVLRYDDRGFAQSEGDASLATTFDLAVDTESAVAYLKTLPYVDQASIGIIGHSEGAIIAPIVAHRNKDIAFVVLMAGSGVDGIATLEDQTAAILRAQQAPENYIEQTVAANLAIYAVVIDEQKSLEQRKEEVAHILASMGLPSAQVEAQLGTLFSPWYRTFLVLDPSRYLGGLSIPVMILNGTKDTQVSADLQVSAIEKALREGGNLRFTTKIYDGLNHLFQPAITGAVEEYGVIEVTMDPQVLADIAWWVTEGRLQL